MDDSRFGRWVDVSFDCLPLRTMVPWSPPEDASPKLAAKFERIGKAIETHGTLNSYYLHNATCTFHLTNDPDLGMCQFAFEGVILTDANDMQPRSCDLKSELVRDTCSWLTQSVVDWMAESVQHAVLVEFDRFIRAGDLSKTIERIEAMRRASDDSEGYVGMYL